MQTSVRYEPLGYNQITDLSAAVGLGQGLTNNAVPKGANVAIISITGQAVRYRDDGVAPSATVGMSIPVNTVFEYSGNLSAIQLIQTTASGKADVAFYKIAG